MRAKDKRIHRKSKEELRSRLENIPHVRSKPMLEASNIHYELSERIEAIHCGGIGAMHLLARSSGLIEELDSKIHLFKFHMPYHESDHILNLCYNIIAGGQCIEDLELLRKNPAYLDALGATRIPDPTTARDFLGRFAPENVESLMDTINTPRVKIWRRQSRQFRKQAILQIDATIEETNGECKKGMDLSYNGKWGYAPLIVSLAWTLKAWMGLLMPARKTGREIIRMEFRRFLTTFINIPAQIVNKSRQLWYRLVGYMSCAPQFFGFVRYCRALRL